MDFYYMDLLTLLIIVLTFGLVVGSFIGAYTYRWPRGISIKKGRSICPKCKNKISWFDNIPLVSYILLWGKCRKCRKNISLRYPLIEFSTALLFAAIYYFYSVGISGGTINLWIKYIGDWTLPYFVLVFSALFVVFVIDLEHKLIPDEVTFFIMSLSFLFLILSSNPAFYGIVFFAFLSSLFFLFLNFITKGKGMGLGDVKLVAAMGLAFLDWKNLLTWLFLSFVLGAVIGILLIILGKAKFGKQIPFGPFIILSFFVTILWGNILAGYLFPYW